MKQERDSKPSQQDQKKKRVGILGRRKTAHTQENTIIHRVHFSSLSLSLSLSLSAGQEDIMFITKFLQMAVKKGPFARGGLKWKGHGAFAVTQTRKTNAKKRLKYVNENDSVLREAAANDPKLIAMRMSEASSDGNNSSSSSSSSSE